jgi:hypothetical protein
MTERYRDEHADRPAWTPAPTYGPLPSPHSARILKEEMDGWRAAVRKQNEERLKTEARIAELEAALRECAEDYINSCEYKGDYLKDKHCDKESFERYMAIANKGKA